jgi:putative PIN family toxin of toxin-antitoxin system
VRLVVDTNLLIRTLLSPGPARQFFQLAPLSHQVVYHSEQLDELRDVVARPRLKIAPEAVIELVERIERYGQRVDADLDVQLDCRDSKDYYVLAVALAGKAEVILTEDDDLLVLDPWRGIRVMRLFSFLQDYPLQGQSKVT